jgi:hypothetical protein
MKKNVGGVDRVVWVVAGIALIAWAIAGGPVWAWIGVLPVLTGSLGYCPAYVPFGISTCGKKE